MSNAVLTLVASILLVGLQTVHAQTINSVDPGTAPPDGIIKLTFSAPVTPTSVKIGDRNASIVSPLTLGNTFEVTVPSDTPEGAQPIAVLVVGVSKAITASVTIAPQATRIDKIETPIIQSGGILSLVLNKQVTPQSVQIGTAQGSFDRTPTHRLSVNLPTDLPLGRQTINLKTDKDPDFIVGSVTVAPLILGLLPKKDSTDYKLSRVVVGGGEVLVKFGDKVPSGIKQILNVRLINTSEAKPGVNPCLQGEQPVVTVPEDDYLIVKTPASKLSNLKSLFESTYALRVCAADTPLDKEIRLRVQNVYYLYIRSTIIALLFILLIYLLYRVSRWVQSKRPEGKQQAPYYFLKMLLLEPENQTYSLSRAQFLGWMIVIVWCYAFLYYVHGYVEEHWSYPDFGNSIFAFVISLGTLIAAQATNRTMGVKGAGEEHPSLADLVVHGGVLALDRVQQVVWTLLTLGMFIRITVSTFETATTLPDIPNELLMLMGLSSAGYLGGKLVRGPGPVIDQVTARDGSLVLTVTGKHISKDAFVWIDGVQLAKEKVKVTADDPDDPVKFAKELELTLDDSSVAEWHGQSHAITVVNNDAQRADWRTLPVILKVNAGVAVGGNVPLTIRTAYAPRGATIEAKDANSTSMQDANDPNLFTVSVPESWVTSEHDLVLKAVGRESIFKFKPAAEAGAGEGAGGGVGAGGGEGAGAGEGAAGGEGAGGGEGGQ